MGSVFQKHTQNSNIDYVPNAKMRIHITPTYKLNILKLYTFRRKGSLV